MTHDDSDGVSISFGLGMMANKYGFIGLNRLLQNGTLDKTFGKNGMVAKYLGTGTAAAITNSGKYIVGGQRIGIDDILLTQYLGGESAMTPIFYLFQ